MSDCRAALNRLEGDIGNDDVRFSHGLIAQISVIVVACPRGTTLPDTACRRPPQWDRHESSTFSFVDSVVQGVYGRVGKSMCGGLYQIWLHLASPPLPRSALNNVPQSGPTDWRI
jgi:hypothetical protein